MTEFVNVTKAGVTRPLQPEAIVLMDPATGNPAGVAAYPLLSAVTVAPTTGNSVLVSSADRTFQATVTGVGAVTATVIIEGSNNGANFLPLGTITLSDTTSASDGFVSAAPWVYVRARLTAISGTSAAVSAQMGA